MVDDLAQVLAARDPVTAAHSTRVTFLATRLAQWLGWSERRIVELRAAVPLHDVGKITISAKILHKRGPLDEREVRALHPQRGETHEHTDAARDRGRDRQGRDERPTV